MSLDRAVGRFVTDSDHVTIQAQKRWDRGYEQLHESSFVTIPKFQID
jgi:hypothetical protein